MIRTLTLVLATASLAGCSTLGSTVFQNELSVVPGTQQLRFISFYGPIGIAAKIDSPAAAASAPAIQLGGSK
jgi:hypothetical protein